MEPQSNSPLHERLQTAVGAKTYRQIAELTGANHESVRRYLTGYTPRTQFLASFCRTFRVSADWLLTGRGPMRTDEVRAAALREAPAPELLSAIAAQVELLLERVDRLEVFVQTLETRLRSASNTTGGTDGTAASAPARQRARRIAQAIPERPHEAARGVAAPGGP